MSIRFKSLTFRNFLSFGNTETTLDFDKPGTTLIIGRDLDNTSDGQGSNGVGKSAIINALTYAIYDKPVSTISKDNLINNVNKKHMEVSVVFEKDGKTYQIRRTRKMKAGAEGNSVYLIEDGKDITIGNSDTNTLIEKILGISYNVFIRIVVFSASKIPFLELPFTHPSQANQTDIIEELFDLTSISEKAVALKEMIKDIETKIDIKKTRIGDLEKEHTRHNQQLTSAKQRVIQWAHQNETQFTDLSEQLKLVQNLNIEQQEQLLNLKDEYLKQKSDNEAEQKTHKGLVDNHLNKQLQEYDKKIKDIYAWINKLKGDADTKSRENITLKEKINHLKDGRCPECKQAFPNTADKIKEYEDAISKNIELIDGIHNNDLTSKTKDLDDASIAIRDLMEKINVERASILKAQQLITEATLKIKELNKDLVVQTRDELYQLKNQELVLKNKIEEQEKADNPFLEPLDELESIKLDPINYDELNELNKVLEHQKFLVKLLTKKDSFVRKVLINKNIPYLNNRLQHYLSIIGLPHKVEFTHEMACVITQFGKELDFGNLSAGQQARVNLALSFAFRDVLENLHTHVNICMMDEVLDHALDSIGLQAAARLLKRKARDEHLSLFIISHRNEIGHSFDKTLTVELSKGFSSILEN